MPERVTKEERMVSLAIEKARKTIETLRESTQVIPYDSEVEVQKIKRPKVQDASKITNQTQDKEGYGLAGETLKKEDIPLERDIRSLGIISTRTGENIKDFVEYLNSKGIKKLTRKQVDTISDVKQKYRTSFDMSGKENFFLKLAISNVLNIEHDFE